MPELPEVETLKRGLLKTILGKKIKDVEVRLPKVISLGPHTVSNIRLTNFKTAAEFRKLLRNQKIRSINRRAKMLIFDLSKESSLPRRGEGSRERSNQRKHLQPLFNSSLLPRRQAGARGEGNMVLLIHLKMTGQLIFAKKGERKKVKILNLPGSRVEELPHQYTHVIFHFNDGSRLYYNDLRQFGYLRLVLDKDLAQVRELLEYGPEPLAKDFSAVYLLSRAKRRPALTVKQFLMDPKVVAGIGNIYSDEILYWAGIRPHRRLRSLTPPDWRKIYSSTLGVLKKAIKAQGSSVGDFFTLDGSEGAFGKQHMVYGRYGETCYTCGEKIARIKLGGRTSSYCPVCQK